MVSNPRNMSDSLLSFVQIRTYPLLQLHSVRGPGVNDRTVDDVHRRNLFLNYGIPDLEKDGNKKADLSDLKGFRKKQLGFLPDLDQKGKEQDLAKAESVSPMQIFIKTTAGSHVVMQIWDKMIVMDLKEEIQDKLGFPVTTQILIFSGQCMQDQMSLQHYKVAKDSTIVLTHRLRGGSKGASSKTTGSYCDAAKGKGSQKRKEPTVAHTLPGQYIVDQAPENPSITLDLPEVKHIFTDLIKNAVICRFNGFWPKTDALYQWIHSTWTEKCQINLCAKGFFIVNFYTEEDKEKILSAGPWFWGNAGLFITPWFPEFDPNSLVVTRMPVWVRLHNLPIHFWHFNTLSIIGNTLGRMLKVDPERHIKGIFTFARICVEVDLSKGLPESIILTFNNTPWKQPLDYENTAFRCRGCQQTGHLLNACKSQSKNKQQQRKPKGWQNINELIKKNAAAKKASSNREDAETEGEDDDTTTENDETGDQKENTADQETPEHHSNQIETQHEQVVLTSTDHGGK